MGTILIVIYEIREKYFAKKKFIIDKNILQSEEKMYNLRKLLENFGINYRDKEKINELIIYINKEKERDNLGNSLKTKIKFWGNYLIIPVATYFLTKIFENLSSKELFKMAFASIFLLLYGILLIEGICIICDTIFNRKIQLYEQFIFDLEQLLLFDEYPKYNWREISEKSN